MYAISAIALNVTLHILIATRNHYIFYQYFSFSCGTRYCSSVVGIKGTLLTNAIPSTNANNTLDVASAQREPAQQVHARREHGQRGRERDRERGGYRWKGRGEGDNTTTRPPGRGGAGAGKEKGRERGRERVRGEPCARLKKS